MTKVDDTPKARLERPAHPVPKEARKRPFIVEFYGSAIAKKWLMAITGIMLMGFVFAHMVGNLKMYLGAEHINSYADWLRTMGEPVFPRTVLLWGMRIGLTAAFVIHIVSAAQLTQGQLVEAMELSARTHGIDLRRIVVEITETAVLAQVDTARAQLQELRRRGVGIHMDDFGTGYSSISLLRELPITGIKLDRSFVAGLSMTDSRSLALAAGLAGLAEGLRIGSVAEGIETAEQAQIVEAVGWLNGQGYLFGRPQPISYWAGCNWGAAQMVPSARSRLRPGVVPGQAALRG
jgi:EAL domain-containing protein (putative c-di-GMP-specific phosphodiesterase class I)